MRELTDARHEVTIYDNISAGHFEFTAGFTGDTANHRFHIIESGVLAAAREIQLLILAIRCCPGGRSVLLLALGQAKPALRATPEVYSSALRPLPGENIAHRPEEERP